MMYSKIIEAKDGNLIPLCKNPSDGKEIALHSKYNPVTEAERFASTVGENCSFFVVLGLGGGYHIAKLLEKFPKGTFFVLEKSDDDIRFLSKIKCVEDISGDSRVKISGIENLSENFLQFYKPAIHGNITILSLRQWEENFKENASAAKEKINEAIKILAADFSVQRHFGKIWQKNIISNLKMAVQSEKTARELLRSIQNDCGTKDKNQEKIAAIIAAGPSLDENINELKGNRKKYFIIATDTAFSSLLKQGIASDAVISIDGQTVSHEHYLEKLPKNTLYAFDLCTNPSAVRKALKISEKILFFETGHPLAQYASFFDGKQNFLHLDAGSGTVTIAGASLAKQLGFKKIRFFGADFSYIGGKPYARGTYLESKFYSLSSRFCTAENAYTQIMYRTPVITLGENKVTTEILNAYKDSLEDFMKRKSVSTPQDSGKFNYNSFKTKYCKELRETFKNQNEPNESSNAFMTLLPLIAKVGKNFSFIAYLKNLEYND